MQRLTNVTTPSFDLWREPWIQVESTNSGLKWMNIQEVLLQAQTLQDIYEPSPLVVVGIHRLLTAILQDIFKPLALSDLEGLWNTGHFSPEKIIAFGQKYSNKFDIFSETDPFYQTGDLPIAPEKISDTKTTAYLIPEMPSGSNIIHFTHLNQSDYVLCPICAAGGLVVLPAFATSGGSGIKPSINGVPPIYILPGGKNLFESLVLSLITRLFQPQVSDPNDTEAWWGKPSIVMKSKVVTRVGYLHSLTFQARRVRLHPEILDTICSRCGQYSHLGASTMIFEMGESRLKDSAPWFDPFAAYRIRGEKVIPIRPSLGHATWREFGSLFLKNPESEGKKEITIRPTVLDQIANLFQDDDQTDGSSTSMHSFRCVGLRTDMKAKIFEWIDTGFLVPDRLLYDGRSGREVDLAISLSSDVGSAISKAFRISFGGTSKSERFHRIKTGMIDAYWQQLASPFRDFIISLDLNNPAETQKGWQEIVLETARKEFKKAAIAVGDDAIRLRQRVEGERLCNILLSKLIDKEKP
jgi:CRISPR system Cascade subunit CasA